MEGLAYLLSHVAPSLAEWAAMLFPLAIYLLWLGFGPGRSPHPIILTGKRDTIYLVLALSGFLLIGPPTWLLERFARMGWKWYAASYAVYLMLVLSLLWSWISYRRKSLVIYSINPEAFPSLMRERLDALQLPYQITPGRIAVAGNRLVIDLQASALLYTLTLSWSGEKELWNQLQPPLMNGIKSLTTAHNPAGAMLPLYGGLALLFVSLSAVIFGWYWAYLAL